MSLYEKIYNVMNESEGLEKDLVVGTGTSSYKAVGEKEVLNMLKPLFKKYKLIVFPIDGEISETNSSWESEYNGKKETKTRNVTQLRASFKIVDIETGESETLVGFGNGADSQDKGSGKAFTYAFKTMLSKTFMLFSGEDTDNDHSDDIGRRPQNTPQQPKPAGNDNYAPKPKGTQKTDSAQPSDLEKRAAAIYFTMTGDKKGQLGWPVEEYKKWLKGFKEVGSISTDYGKKWTVDDLEFLEARVAELEPPF
jgi:hypothetical protein